MEDIYIYIYIYILTTPFLKIDPASFTCFCSIRFTYKIVFFKGFDSYYTSLQQPHNNPSHEGGFVV
jgi:hypothetical protein